MVWILIAISAHFFWGLQNVADKYILGNRVKNPYVYLIWYTMTGVIALVILPFVDIVLPDGKNLFFLFLASAVYFFGGIPYMKAMKIEEPTRISVWWNLIPLFSLFIGWSFFDEKFNIPQLLALLILIFGAVLASMHAKGKRIVFSKAVWYMMLAGFSFSIYGVLLHHVTKEIPFISVFIWTHFLMVVFSLTMLFSNKIRKDFFEETKLMNFNLIIIISLVSFVGHLGTVLNQWALSYAPAALVFSMEGTQAIFVFLIMMLFSIFKPDILKEELDGRNILFKVLAILLMVVGVLILAFS